MAVACRKRNIPGQLLNGSKVQLDRRCVYMNHVESATASVGSRMEASGRVCCVLGPSVMNLASCHETNIAPSDEF